MNVRCWSYCLYSSLCSACVKSPVRSCLERTLLFVSLNMKGLSRYRHGYVTWTGLSRRALTKEIMKINALVIPGIKKNTCRGEEFVRTQGKLTRGNHKGYWIQSLDSSHFSEIRTRLLNKFLISYRCLATTCSQCGSIITQGLALAEPGGSWRLTLVFDRPANLKGLEVMCSQLPSTFLRAKPYTSPLNWSLVRYTEELIQVRIQIYFNFTISCNALKVDWHSQPKQEQP